MFGLFSRICRPWSVVALGVLTASPAQARVPYEPDESTPPEPAREFRGVWVTTVHNVDWPSREGLPPRVQQTELLEILDRCVELRLNAVILQVRSECDALYPSKIEPWSPWLTGTMGGDPGYDPLAFAVKEAHRRGLELHAWFNPFRAINSKHGRISKDHISRTHPAYTTAYGNKVWLDPNIEFVRERALNVIEDVVTRYPIDAVHLDDYFYPYPVKSGSSYKDFNDYKSWKAYLDRGGILTRPEWRRHAVNTFVQELNRRVKTIDPYCKVGISPFGIYRPGQPAQVKNSLDSYDQIYADVRLWWREGWMDYLSPQLYWSSDHPQYNFAGLFQWWRDENATGRHLWPGIALYRIKTEKRSAYDSLRQIRTTRTGNPSPTTAGTVLFSVKSIMENHSNVNAVLRDQAFPSRAIVPESPWLAGDDAIPVPRLRVVTRTPAALIAEWMDRSESDAVRWWLVEVQRDGKWEKHGVFPASTTSCAIPGRPERFSVRALDLAGQLGEAATLRRLPAPSDRVANP